MQNYKTEKTELSLQRLIMFIWFEQKADTNFYILSCFKMEQ